MRLVLCLFVGLVGCIPPANPTQRLSDAAYDMNTASRFGRMDVAMEHVSGEARAEFARSHAEWGRHVRVVDVELSGMTLKTRTEAEVVVVVTWQKIDEADVRVTNLVQRFRDVRGSFLLVSEEEKGDQGLLAFELENRLENRLEQKLERGGAAK